MESIKEKFEKVKVAEDANGNIYLGDLQGADECVKVAEDYVLELLKEKQEYWEHIEKTRNTTVNTIAEIVQNVDSLKRVIHIILA